MRILITGASGFIGRHLAKSFADDVDLHLMVRSLTGNPREVQGDLLDKESLRKACRERDIVFHCAGYAHSFEDAREESERLHRQINFEGAVNIAQAAVAEGVNRFVFLSSVKAVGEPCDLCADETFNAPPQTPYGRAKRDAEKALLAIKNMEVVCLRPAMVYGPGGKGNLERMATMIRRGLFPPLPETRNRRSLIHVHDLVEAMRLAAQKPQASGKTYIVADPQTYSGRHIYDALRKAMNLSPVRWSVPAFMLKMGALTGDAVQNLVKIRVPLDQQALDRLLGSACYNPALIEKELGWKVKISLAEGLEYLR